MSDISSSNTPQSLQNQVNSIARNLQNSETVSIFKDDEGTRRVLAGKGANGFYGFKVSQPGVDVYDATDDQLVFNSSQNVFKIIATYTLTIPALSLNTGGANYAVSAPQTVNVNHGLSFTPAFLAYAYNGTTYIPLPWTSSGAFGSGGFSYIELQASSDATKITVSGVISAFNKNTTYPDTNVKIFVLQETAN